MGQEFQPSRTPRPRLSHSQPEAVREILKDKRILNYGQNLEK
jgi:hypothetical protein